MKFTSKSILICIIIIAGLIIIQIFGQNIFPNYPLFDYSLNDILTFTFLGILVYLLSNKDNLIQRKNHFIEKLIEQFRTKMTATFGKPISINNQAFYLSTFKFFDNKLLILEILSSHLNCKDELGKISNYRNRLDDFIFNNLDKNDDYFLTDSFKAKIEDFLNNIDYQLDLIISKMYKKQ